MWRSDGWGEVDVGLGMYFWGINYFFMLFVLIFRWDVLVSDDCDGVVMLFGGVDCWWVNYCVGCYYLGVDFVIN